MALIKRILVTIIIWTSIVFAQSPDSVTITFRTYQAQGNNVFVPGQFNNWGPNSSGVISAGAPSQMIYDASLSAYIKTYTFKIHDESRTPLGDSVYMYKFNTGGISSGWYSDPLNPEQNANDNNNSVLRLTKLFIFEFLAAESDSQFTRITTGIVHADSDTIVSVKFYTGVSPDNIISMTEIGSFYNESKRILDYTLPVPIDKSSYFKLVATNNNGDSTIYQNTVVEVIVLPLPSYAKNGVTLPSQANGDSVTFRLRVPGKSYVLLRVAEEGQSLVNATPLVMHKDPDSDNWWLNVKLSSDTKYEYLYEIENGKKVTDPFSRYIGAAGTQFSTGEDGLSADDYIWQAADYERPPLNKAVIYELHVGEFAGGYYNKSAGTAGFSDLRNLIRYFDSLGVNVIELMPINDYGNVGKSNHSWGYDLNSYFAIEPAFGTPLELKLLIDEAHKYGIAVILDVVFNHQNDTGPLWQMLPDEALNPYFKLNSDLRYNEDGLAFFKDMDHWTNETQELILECLKMWIDEYKIDGFRYDYTQGIGWNKDLPKVGVLGWSNIIDTLYQGKIYQIAEHLPESPALIYYSGLTSGWHDSFHDELFDEARFQNRSLFNLEKYVEGLGAYSSNDIPSNPSEYASRTGPVNATITHDEQSLIFEMKQFQGVPETTAVRRDKLYGTFIFGSLGIPMLWEGQEFSEPRGWTNDGQKLSYRPVQFSYLSTQRGKDHYSYYRSLVMQRKFNPALYNGELKKLYRYDASEVLVWGFEDTTTNSKVMFVANLSNAEKTVTSLPWLGTGMWYDVFDQSMLEVTTSPLESFTVPAYSALVYSNKTNHELGIPTSIEWRNDLNPASYSLSQNYPNPFNPSTEIVFQIAEPSMISLRIFDILGREVKTLLNEEKQNGRYSIRWNGDNNFNEPVSSGIYFYKLDAGSFTSTKKMMLLR